MAMIMNHENIRMAEQEPAVNAKVEPSNVPEVIEERRKDVDGRVLCVNKYMVGRMLGKGGFAKVYLGMLMPTKQQYALKIVAKSSLVKARAKQKLQTEIKIHRSLRHNTVVRFDRFFEDFDNAYMILELCNNNSMSELMKKRKKLSEPETRFYLLQIVSCLQYLHENLVIHRDLKLGNLFLDVDMRIKVGDFGLATKMSHRDERRKTVCGTPNYIAPEILEGKDGHSFEVDIWSTGVIMYTLLIGKPPFESKDVKSTYKRILANAYTFPDHTPICGNAKKLISQLLQPRPEQRPSLDAIVNHPFFSSYTPAALPESALRDCPTMQQLMEMDRIASSEVRHRDFGGDENDPSVLNRLQTRLSQPQQQEAAGKIVVRKSAEPLEANREAALRPRSLNVMPTTTAVDVLPLKQQSSSQPAYATRQQARSNSAGAGTKIGVENAPPSLYMSERSTTSSSSSTIALTGSSMGNGINSITANSKSTATRTSNPTSSLASAAPLERGYVQKFDIFVDSRTQSQPQQSSTHRVLSTAASQQTVISSRKNEATEKKSAGNYSSSMNSDGKTSFLRRSNDNLTTDRKSSLSSSSSSSSSSAAVPEHGQSLQIDQVQMDMEHVTLHEPERKLQKQTYSQKHGDAYLTSSLRPKQEAWAWDDHKDAFPLSVNVAPPNHMAMALSSSSSSSQGKLAQSSRGQAAAPFSEPMCMGTPPDQIMSSNDNNKKAMGTLETMHEMLNTSFSMIANGCSGGVGAGAKASHHHPHQELHLESEEEIKSSNDVNKLVAKVWVVRYVDYTSKYGLGFLFNTGSAGVYFNDSTKIVLSADGAVFNYIERRRKDSSSGSEHSSQTHLITSYPPELQKKVTLLRHFRNYLLDQQKSSGSGNGQYGREEGPEGDNHLYEMGTMNLNTNHGLIKDGFVAEGASTNIKFGSSSVRYVGGMVTALGAGESSYSAGGEEEFEMPFLKKWVRTKHAILFRISNRTVQVVFYDRSEVLLSSEARVITFVNKQGFRTEHSLDDVLHSGRLDIAKRLKYTKDIMYRLINTQVK